MPGLPRSSISSDDAIIAITLEGRITSWNASAERNWGYTTAEAIGQFTSIIVPPDRLGGEVEVLRRLSSGEMIGPFETVRLRKDGQPMEVSLTVSPVRSRDGRVVGASEIVRDITEQKRVRRERERLLEAAETANRAKDEFLAMVGHELRNPIAALSAAGEVLARAGKRADLAHNALAIIARQIDQLSRLVDDLVDVARLMTGKIGLYRQPVNIADCVTHCIRAMRGTKQLDSHDFRAETVSAWVDGDADRLEQIVMNLLSNAAKHTPSGGSILISVKTESNGAVLCVKDSGVGIPPELLPHVFDLLVQGERQLDRSQGGGIGLTIIKRLAELHGGTVEAVSEGRGRGSCFTMHLPLIAAPAPPQTELAQQGPETTIPSSHSHHR